MAAAKQFVLEKKYFLRNVFFFCKFAYSMNVFIKFIET